VAESRINVVPKRESPTPLAVRYERSSYARHVIGYSIAELE